VYKIFNYNNLSPKVEETLALIAFSSLFYLWSFNLIDLKILIIPSFLFIVLNFYNKKIKTSNLKLHFLLLSFLISHYFLAYILNQHLLIKFDLRLALAFFVIFTISVQYEDLLIKNLKIIFILFLFFFIFELIQMVFSQKELFLDDNFKPSRLIMNCDNGLFSRLGLIYQENSHFGMISVPFLLFICARKFFKKKILNLFVIIFIFVCFLSYSTTFLFGLFISSILIIIKFLLIGNTKKISIFFLLAILSFSFLTFDKTCNKKILQTLDLLGIQIVKKNLEIKDQNKDLKNEKKEIINLSTQVFDTNLRITLSSLKDNGFFGVGLNNYPHMHRFYNKKVSLGTYSEANVLNSKDGSSNFIKVFAEFGLFIFIFIFCFIYYFLNSKHELSFFSFTISLIVTQAIRGAGYYNAGFLVCATIIIIFTFQDIIKKING
tara:strand:+ start:1102 stop:2403 length:1302 start_codon:yes stop_codon:yes gene_type:complete